jgi:hypothetical protein
MMFMLLFAATWSATAQIIFVDDDARGTNDGSCWTNAYRFLQDALAAAQEADEIRVARGTYKPDQGAGIEPGSRAASFQLKDSVVVLGGFSRHGGAEPNDRDIHAYKTFLNGDFQDNDRPRRPRRASPLS